MCKPVKEEAKVFSSSYQGSLIRWCCLICDLFWGFVTLRKYSMTNSKASEKFLIKKHNTTISYCMHQRFKYKNHSINTKKMHKFLQFLSKVYPKRSFPLCLGVLIIMVKPKFFRELEDHSNGKNITRCYIEAAIKLSHEQSQVQH